MKIHFVNSITAEQWTPLYTCVETSSQYNWNRLDLGLEHPVIIQYTMRRNKSTLSSDKDKHTLTSLEHYLSFLILQSRIKKIVGINSEHFMKGKIVTKSSLAPTWNRYRSCLFSFYHDESEHPMRTYAYSGARYYRSGVAFFPIVWIPLLLCGFLVLLAYFGTI